MDNNRLQQLRRLATDSLVTFADDEKAYSLAQALEEAVEAIDDFDSMYEKSTALEEENAELSNQVSEISDSLRDIYRITKSSSLSDVKRLTEIQETCESSDVDLSKIV